MPVAVTQLDDRNLGGFDQTSQVAYFVETGPVPCGVLAASGPSPEPPPVRVGATFGFDVADIGCGPRGHRYGSFVGVRRVDEYWRTFSGYLIEGCEHLPGVRPERDLSGTRAQPFGVAEKWQRHRGEQGFQHNPGALRWYDGCTPAFRVTTVELLSTATT